MLISGFWHCVDTGDFSEKMALQITDLIKADFAAAAVMISFGAVLGKVSPTQMFLIMIVEIFVFGLNEVIGVEHLHAVDMGGSMFVHTYGAYFGLAVSCTYCCS